jgi:hypothetical protein
MNEERPTEGSGCLGRLTGGGGSRPLGGNHRRWRGLAAPGTTGRRRGELAWGREQLQPADGRGAWPRLWASGRRKKALT